MRAALACALVLALSCGSAFAQRIYKYRDANGTWVYTDRQPPAELQYEARDLAPGRESPAVHLFRMDADGGTVLVARNTYYAPVEIAFRLTGMANLSPDTPASGLRLVPARGDAALMSLRPADPAAPMSLEYEFEYLPGAPDARHRPAEPYRLPYALASSHAVSQAFPDQITHDDPSAQHAIDFVMPIGTGIYAARAGVVVDIASDFYEAGVDVAADGPRANMVRVLHDDGTMSLYAHLNWNSIRVVPGQSVARGEYLADSGNTGFSTGPHLHFVVQRNRGGALVSVPVEFAGPGGRAVDVQRGERPVAY